MKIDKIETVPTKASYQYAVVFPDQAQFHPLKYLSGLQTEFLKLDGIFIKNMLISSTEVEVNYHVCKSAGESKRVLPDEDTEPTKSDESAKEQN